MASSAVNLPISSANLRLVVVWMGVRSSRCTNAGACIPLRLNFTRNLVFFIGGLVIPLYSDNGASARNRGDIGRFLLVEGPTAANLASQVNERYGDLSAVENAIACPTN